MNLQESWPCEQGLSQDFKTARPTQSMIPKWSAQYVLGIFKDVLWGISASDKSLRMIIHSGKDAQFSY